VFTAVSALGLSATRADTIVTLDGVTFADGGTASGYFVLNVYGYLEAADITTTPGYAVDSEPMAGATYTTLSGGSVNNAVPFDTGFFFNSVADGFSIALQTEYDVTSGGFDPLVDGSGVPSSPAGSVELCIANATTCGGPAYFDGREVTAGELYAPEPTTLSLLGAGGVLLSVVRRKRARSAIGSAAKGV
jgi:hypothetical protein